MYQRLLSKGFCRRIPELHTTAHLRSGKISLTARNVICGVSDVWYMCWLLWSHHFCLPIWRNCLPKWQRESIQRYPNIFLKIYPRWSAIAWTWTLKLVHHHVSFSLCQPSTEAKFKQSRLSLFIVVATVRHILTTQSTRSNFWRLLSCPEIWNS